MLEQKATPCERAIANNSLPSRNLVSGESSNELCACRLYGEIRYRSLGSAFDPLLRMFSANRLSIRWAAATGEEHGWRT